MQRPFAFALILVVCFALLVGPLAAQDDGPMPVIIDTDMAVDDWMAILYLLQYPDVNVLAVTVSGTGEAHCDPGIQNAMNLLALAGNPEIPVACGRETPLQGTNTFPAAWRTGVDAMMGIDLPQNPNPPSAVNAVDLLRQAITDSPTDVTLMTLGPVTTIAELLQADPALAERIADIYVMGGAVDVPGNVFANGNTTAEWNIYVDPLAAAQMVESGVPVTFIPLDATNSAPLTMAFYDKLAEDRTTAEAEFVFRAVTSQIGFAESGMWYFWDPMAAAVATDESLVTLEDRTVMIVTEEGPQFGRVVATDDGYPVRVAVDADGARFEQLFLNVLNGREAATPLPALETGAESTERTLTPVERVDDILGTWRYEFGDFHFQFRDDGTYRANQSRAGLNSDSPEDLGTYTLDEGLLTLDSGETTRFCAAGNAGVYSLSLTDKGELAFVLQSDECEMRRAPSNAPQLFSQVE